jgi:hypothetical protein
VRDEATADCSWPADDDREKKERYVKKMWMTVEEAERLNVKSELLNAIPIEVKKKRWVLVVDCQKAVASTQPEVRYQRRILDLVAAAIHGILLEANL